MSKGKGFGKVILFGEHFVVYGLPGIASGIDRSVEAEISRIDDEDIVFDDAIFGEVVSRNGDSDHVLCRLFDAMFLDLGLSGVRITISGTCIPGSGMGYSAALCVALARAVNSCFGFGWSPGQINEIAYNGEMLSHGKPSGIDNSCATYGSLVWFEKNLSGKKDKILPFRCGKQLFLVLVSSGIRHDTKKAVELVKAGREQDRELFDKMFKEAETVAYEAKECLIKGDVGRVGLLMNKNQELLRQIGVSCRELENLIDIALVSGALGAKLIGAGLGGSIAALCKDKEHQELIAGKFRDEGFNSVKVKIR
ncbi:MAG: mevalonate kinase [archaeon]|nr:mevalonate kinase [archaeon]